MKNVEKSAVHGKVQKICQGLAKTISAITLGAAVILTPFGPSTAKAEEDGKGVTQLQYVQWLAQLSGAKPGSSSDAYINWAKSLGIAPSGGWKAGDRLNSDALAQTLVQLLGLNANKYGGDNIRILQREGIDLSKIKGDVTKSHLVDLVDEFGGQIIAGLIDPAAKGHTTTTPKPPKPGKPPTDNHKITICHKGHTITVDDESLAAHLAHGDTIGPCTVTKHNHDRDDDDHDSGDHGGHDNDSH